jgi:hypothetical protein
MMGPTPRAADRDRAAGQLLLAAIVAGTLSGVPSTSHALVTGRDPIDSIRAAATLIPGSEARSPTREVFTGIAVHGVLTLAWTAALTAALPYRHSVSWGAVAGLGIAALDLGLVGPRFPAIAALPVGGQIADHVVFGALVGLVRSRRTPDRAARSRRSRSR